MTHTQERHTCKACGREVVIDFVINGTTHHAVLAVTCMDCIKDKTKLLGDKVEYLNYESQRPSQAAQ